MEFSKTYKSGLRLTAKQIPSLYTVSFGIFVDVGSSREEPSCNGYSHFIEHLMFKGTEKRSASSISEEMDDIGANLNAFTSKDVTCYYTKSASANLAQCVDLLSDMYFNASFPEEEIEREKNVVIEEIMMGEDVPDDVSQDLIAQAVFYKQKMGQTIVGTVENIRNSDRHSILEFKKKYYSAENTVISVAGNFLWDELDALVTEYFENCFSDVCGENAAEDKTVYTSEFLYKFKEGEQVHLELAAGTCSLSDKRRYAVSLMTNILGGGMSSRLFQTVREKNGLAYSVYAFPSFYRNCGYLEIYCGINPENTVKVSDLLQRQIAEFAEKGVTDKELARAKAQAVNGIYMGMENSLTVMRLFGQAMLKTGAVYSVEDNIERYGAVNAAEVNNLAKEIFSQKFASSYVGRESKNFDVISKVRPL